MTKNDLENKSWEETSWKTSAVAAWPVDTWACPEEEAWDNDDWAGAEDWMASPP
jgi:hypothetical protein